MARKTSAQKLETLVASVMKKSLGNKLSDNIQRKFGAEPDFAAQIWAGYRDGDVSVRTMFHARIWISDPEAFTLDDLIGLANATLEAFPDGVVSEAKSKHIIWRDTPGLCPATGYLLEKKIAHEPGVANALIARLDELVEPAGSAATYTLSRLGYSAHEGAVDEALMKAARAEVQGSFVNLLPPSESAFGKEQWIEALCEAVLEDEVSLIGDHRFASALLEHCPDDAVIPTVRKFRRFTSHTIEILDALIERARPRRDAFVQELVAAGEDDAAWNFASYDSPTRGLYLALVVLELYRESKESVPEAALPALERFVHEFQCNWSAALARRTYLARVYTLMRMIPGERLGAVVHNRLPSRDWDAYAILPSKDAAELAVAHLMSIKDDWTSDYEPTACTFAKDAFALLGGFAAAALESHIKAKDASSRARVAMMLAANSHIESTALLARMLHDGSKKVRAIAAAGFEEKPAHAASEALAEVLSAGKKDARIAAATALVTLSPGHEAYAVARAHLEGKERVAEVRELLGTITARD